MSELIPAVNAQPLYSLFDIIIISKRAAMLGWEREIYMYISPQTIAPQYQPIEKRKRKRAYI